MGLVDISLLRLWCESLRTYSMLCSWGWSGHHSGFFFIILYYLHLKVRKESKYLAVSDSRVQNILEHLIPRSQGS